MKTENHTSQGMLAQPFSSPDTDGPAVALHFAYDAELVELLKNVLHRQRTRSPWAGGWSKRSRCWWVIAQVPYNLAPGRKVPMSSATRMQSVVYNRLEFTIPTDDARFAQFGKDLLKLIEDYSDVLIGYQAECIDETSDQPETICEDAGSDEAVSTIPEIFRFAE
jgi:hypothetical protein